LFFFTSLAQAANSLRTHRPPRRDHEKVGTSRGGHILPFKQIENHLKNFFLRAVSPALTSALFASVPLQLSDRRRR
jgi:hypothetical protein